MDTNTILGYRAFHHSSGKYLHFDPVQNWNFLDNREPAPISRADAHRRIAAFVEQPSEQYNDDFSIDPVFHKPTPLETASAELGGLLESLCNRHGLNLGLTREQINAQLAKELEELGTGGRAGLIAGIPRR